MHRVGRWKTPRRASPGTKPRTFAQGHDTARQYEIQRQQWLFRGSLGPAGPCKRICPTTGQVLGIIEKGEENAAEPQAEL